MQIRNARAFLGTVLLVSVGVAACNDVPQHRSEDTSFSLGDLATTDTGQTAAHTSRSHSPLRSGARGQLSNTPGDSGADRGL
jgi:hypothetical protein